MSPYNQTSVIAHPVAKATPSGAVSTPVAWGHRSHPRDTPTDQLPHPCHPPLRQNCRRIHIPRNHRPKHNATKHPLTMMVIIHLTTLAAGLI